MSMGRWKLGDQPVSLVQNCGFQARGGDGVGGKVGVSGKVGVVATVGVRGAGTVIIVTDAVWTDVACN
jgi:hypothetical protein